MSDQGRPDTWQELQRMALTTATQVADEAFSIGREADRIAVLMRRELGLAMEYRPYEASGNLNVLTERLETCRKAITDLHAVVEEYKASLPKAEDLTGIWLRTEEPKR